MTIKLEIKAHIVNEEGQPFLYPQYGQMATEKFIDDKPFLTKHQTKTEALVHIQRNCLTSPRVELYAVEEGTGEVYGHLFLCPGDDLHYGEVVSVRTFHSFHPRATRMLWKMSKQITKTLNVPYLANVKWNDDGSYTTHFVEVK
ncbi:MAG: hypothetical protein ACRDCE_18070 [Cetobacterium sp.]|uniref:hypothetical protein n=1 Tax=Cetobacterium sp. TaxID=2071632 RepID=UPI003EE68901